MPTPPLDPEHVQEARRIYEEKVAEGFAPYGTGTPGRSAARRAAEILAAKYGLTINGAEARIRRCIEPERTGEVEQQRPASPSIPIIEHPLLPDSDEPIEDLIDKLDKVTTRRRVASQAKDWRTIRVRGSGPVGIANMGDPHLDNEGCNWALLRRDIKIIQETEGLFAGNVGDSLDNWNGRLLKLKGNTSVTDANAWRLAEWFFAQLGDKLLYWLLGNHDAWGDGAHIFQALGKRIIKIDDWQCRFILEFDNRLRIPVWAAHSFKGSSIYNKLHGAERADLFSRGAARLYISGHHHEWACTEEECPERKITYWKLKARGYKFVDTYAENLQFFPQESGATVTAIIDPDARHEAQLIRCFPDLEEAADFLTWKRSRAR